MNFDSMFTSIIDFTVPSESMHSKSQCMTPSMEQAMRFFPVFFFILDFISSQLFGMFLFTANDQFESKYSFEWMDYDPKLIYCCMDVIKEQGIFFIKPLSRPSNVTHCTVEFEFAFVLHSIHHL